MTEQTTTPAVYDPPAATLPTDPTTPPVAVALEPVPTEAPEVPEVPELVAPAGGELVTLPSGFRVALRSAKSIRNRDRKALYSGINIDPAAAQTGQLNAFEFAFDLLANIQKLLIVGWDVRAVDDAGVPFGDVLPLPSIDPAGLEDLPIADAAALDKYAEEVQKIISPDFSPNPDPASPTPPSAG